MPNWTTNILEMENIVNEPLYKDNDDSSKDFDFNKIVQMPKELENTRGGLVNNKAIDAYLSAVNPKTSDMGKSKFNQKAYDYVIEEILKSKCIRGFSKKRYGNMGRLEVMEESRKYYADSIKVLKEKQSTRNNGDSIYLLRQGRDTVRNILLYKSISWYDWRLMNWGCKWNASGTCTDEYSPDTVYFETPWGPPVEAIMRLSKKYPDREIILKFKNEDSVDAIGKLTFKDGLMVKEEYPKLDTQEGLELLMELDGDYYVGRNEDGTLYFQDPDEE